MSASFDIMQMLQRFVWNRMLSFHLPCRQVMWKWWCCLACLSSMSHKHTVSWVWQSHNITSASSLSLSLFIPTRALLVLLELAVGSVHHTVGSVISLERMMPRCANLSESKNLWLFSWMFGSVHGVFGWFIISGFLVLIVRPNSHRHWHFLQAFLHISFWAYIEYRVFREEEIP